MKLPKSWTAITRFSIALAMALFVALPFAGFYLGYRYRESLIVPDVRIIEKIATPTSGPATRDVSAFPRLYWLKNTDGTTVYSALPVNSMFTNTPGYPPEYQSAKVTIGGNVYSVAANAGGRSGPCPMGETDPAHCRGVDQKITSPVEGVTIAAVRIWQDDPRGIFMLNPWEIKVYGHYINNITVTKVSPDTKFSQSEVDQWLNIFSSINFENN